MAGGEAGEARLPERVALRLEGLPLPGSDALVVAADDATDPEIAAWTGAAHLGPCLLVAAGRETPRLGYLTPMERQEAAACGLPVLTPERLGVEELRRRSAGGAELWSELLARALALCGVESPARIALGGRQPLAVGWELGRALADAGFRPVDAGEALAALRRRKSSDELAAIRRAAAGACEAMRRVAELLADASSTDGELSLGGRPLTAGHLRAAVAAELARAGLEQPRGNIVAAGREAGIPHSAGADERVLAPGEALVVDLFPRGRLFADVTRTFCVGPPPEALARAHAAVRDALASARERARPGVRGWDLQQSTCHRFEDLGYPSVHSTPDTRRGYVHNLGHGVGYELHEAPSFRREAGEEEGRLVAGDLFTLEPGLYEPDEGWGVRLEDLCLLGDERLEVLTPLPYELDPGAW